MNVLVTGANGFVGRNLCSELKNREIGTIYECDIDTTTKQLDEYVSRCDFVFHLAGVNRPQNPDDFLRGNRDFTSDVLALLKKWDNKAPIIFSSSIQAELDNPYGVSKREGEQVIFEYGKETGTKVMVYRLPNLFGKWCRPNYNSVVATFCNNIAHGLPIEISNREAEVTLAYIDDVVDEFIQALKDKETSRGDFCYVDTTSTVSLGYLADLLYRFKSSRDDLEVPNMSDAFTKKLYSTYLTYLPEGQFSYPLDMKRDDRGYFAEFLRFPDRGQVSINVSKPGITKGQHWHHTKNEKFLVIGGKGLFQFRKIGTEEVIEYRVSGEKLEEVDIPPGYTHNIINEGTDDLITVIWANEAFDPEHPDTYYEEV